MNKYSPQKHTTPKLLPTSQVLKIIPICRATLYKWMAEGRFPRQLRLSKSRVAWLESEVIQWIAERSSARALARKSPKSSPEQKGGGDDA